MSVFLPNGRNFIRKCLHSKHAQVFFTAINTVIHGFLLPAHLWLYLTYVIVLGYSALRALFIVVQMCAAMRAALYTAAACCINLSAAPVNVRGCCMALAFADG